MNFACMPQISFFFFFSNKRFHKSFNMILKKLTSGKCYLKDLSLSLHILTSYYTSHNKLKKKREREL